MNEKQVAQTIQKLLEDAGFETFVKGLMRFEWKEAVEDATEEEVNDAYERWMKSEAPSILHDYLRLDFEDWD